MNAYSQFSLTPVPAARESRFSIKRHWNTGELVTIGVFAAVSKAAALLIAFMGGGMNPLTLLAKNVLFAMLMIVLLRKVPKLGTLTLVTMVSALVSLLLMGQGILHTPGALVTCLIAEIIVRPLGGYRRMGNVVLAVLISELGSKAIGVLIAFISLREQPAMLIPVVIIVAIGSTGTLIGLFCGVRFSKELQRAGIISDI